MSAVTHSTKCYVYVCVGCNLLNYSERNDKLTCSTACRVRAHRNGSLKALRDMAAMPAMDIPPSLIMQTKAVNLLRPDLFDSISNGTMTLDDTRPAVSSAFWSLVCKQASA